jgi:hypothetical protein
MRGLPSDSQEVSRVEGDVPAVGLESDCQLWTYVENRGEVITTERLKICNCSDQAHLSLYAYVAPKFEALLDQLASFRT